MMKRKEIRYPFFSFLYPWGASIRLIYGGGAIGSFAPATGGRIKELTLLLLLLYSRKKSCASFFLLSFMMDGDLLSLYIFLYFSLCYQTRCLLTSIATNHVACGLLVTIWDIYPSLTGCWPYGILLCQIQVRFHISSVLVVSGSCRIDLVSVMVFYRI